MAAPQNIEENVGAADQEHLRQIEELLDQSIRPYMQNDGGDVKLLYLDDQELHIEFIGACRECPHSNTSTFESLRSVVKRYDTTLELVNDTNYTGSN